jgi:hypothetical protein
MDMDIANNPHSITALVVGVVPDESSFVFNISPAILVVGGFG